MEPREAFKIGFMARCVEEGLSHEKTAELMEKAADSTLSGIIDAAKSAIYPAVGLALAAPPTLGGLTAYFKNKTLDSDTDEVEEIKQKEMADSYRRMADQLRRSKALRGRKKSKKRSGQVFL
tara:strand:- start:416 stop:781 length:366 start_codon:yes stop_codon:yes gene_type:complete